MVGMLLSTLLTAVIIAFLGIIGFVGLVVPHMARRIVGSDHRFLLPATILGGGLLLLVSDTVARLILAPHVLPVSVLTAFLGAPVFIYLIIRGQTRMSLDVSNVAFTYGGAPVLDGGGFRHKGRGPAGHSRSQRRGARPRSSSASTLSTSPRAARSWSRTATF